MAVHVVLIDNNNNPLFACSSLSLFLSISRFFFVIHTLRCEYQHPLFLSFSHDISGSTVVRLLSVCCLFLFFSTPSTHFRQIR